MLVRYETDLNLFTGEFVSTDDHLFPKFENHLGGQRFSSADKIAAAVVEYFADRARRNQAIATSMDCNVNIRKGIISTK